MTQLNCHVNVPDTYTMPSRSSFMLLPRCTAMGAVIGMVVDGAMSQASTGRMAVFGVRVLGVAVMGLTLATTSYAQDSMTIAQPLDTTTVSTAPSATLKTLDAVDTTLNDAADQFQLISMPIPTASTDPKAETDGKVSSSLNQDSEKRPNIFQRIWRRFGPNKDSENDLEAPTVSVNVSGAPDVLADNIRAYLRRVTVADLADFRIALPRLRSLSRDAAHAVGYYQATFRFSASDDNEQVFVSVEPNAPVTVSKKNIVISGEGRGNPAFDPILDQPDLAIGDRLDHGLYEKTKSRIVNLASEQGYFDAGWQTKDVQVILPDNVAEIDLNYGTGPRYKFGAIHFENVGDDPTLPVEPRLLAQLLPFKEGDYSDAGDVAKLSRNLLDTRWFNGIQVDTVTPEPIVAESDSNLGMSQAIDAAATVDAQRPLAASDMSNPAQVEATLITPTAITGGTGLSEEQQSGNLADNLQRSEQRMKLARQERVIPVNITLDARRPNSAEAGIGYGTDTGVRLRTQYRRALLNEQGHNIDANLELSKIRQAVDARYNMPYKHPINDTLSFFGGYERELRDQSDSNLDLETQAITFGVERSIRPSADGWQRTLSLRYRIDQLKNNFVGMDVSNLPEPFNVQGVSTTQQALLAGYALNKVKTYGGLDPSRGLRQYYQIEVGSETLLTDVDMAILRAGWRAIESFGATDQHRFVGRLDVGHIQTKDFSRVPYNLRFFAGGDQSIRGYDYKSLSTKEDGYLIGGENLGIASIEYSYRFLPKWRGAVFVDGGNAFDQQFNDPIKVGAGLGVRWSSPIGPIRLDVAAGVSEASVPIRLHFFIGPPL
jgi:translocation and assembly module TamA